MAAKYRPMTTPAEVAHRLGVNPNTVRNWADRFAHHLSRGASPGHGQPREFTQDDVYIFAVIHYYSGQGYDWDAIDDILTAGAYLSEDIPIPEPAPRTESEAIRALQVIQGVLPTIQSERDSLLTERDEYLARIFELERELGRRTGYTEALENEAERLRDSVAVLQNRIVELERQMAALLAQYGG